MKSSLSIFKIYLLFLILQTGSLLSEVIIVSNTHDSGPRSLRDAIMVANASPGSHTIRFDHALAGQTINLLSGLPGINGKLKIEGLIAEDGRSAISIAGNFLGNVITIASGADVALTNIGVLDVLEIGIYTGLDSTLNLSNVAITAPKLEMGLKQTPTPNPFMAIAIRGVFNGERLFIDGGGNIGANGIFGAGTITITDSRIRDVDFGLIANGDWTLNRIDIETASSAEKKVGIQAFGNSTINGSDLNLIGAMKNAITGADLAKVTISNSKISCQSRPVSSEDVNQSGEYTYAALEFKGESKLYTSDIEVIGAWDIAFSGSDTANGTFNNTQIDVTASPAAEIASENVNKQYTNTGLFYLKDNSTAHLSFVKARTVIPSFMIYDKANLKVEDSDFEKAPGITEGVAIAMLYDDSHGQIISSNFTGFEAGMWLNNQSIVDIADSVLIGRLGSGATAATSQGWPLNGVGITVNDDAKIKVKSTRVSEWQEDGFLINNNGNNLIENCIVINNVGNGFRILSGTGTKIVSNHVGMNPDGTRAANGKDGVNCPTGSTAEHNLIALNNIAFNFRGVSIDDPKVKRIRIGENSIANNLGKGISLAPGANDGIHMPTITSASSSDKVVRVSGFFSDPKFPNTNIIIEIFANEIDRGTDKTEGKVFLGKICIITNGEGFATFSGKFLSTNAFAGHHVSSTAIIAAGPHEGDTSEYSPNFKLSKTNLDIQYYLKIVYMQNLQMY